MNDWKIAEARPRREFKKPRLYASLNKRGEIVLNPAAWRIIGDPASVALLYEASTRKIGVKSPVAIDLHFFPLRRYGRERRHRIVRARRLLKQFDVAVEGTVSFSNIQAVNYNGSPMLVLDLKSYLRTT